MPDDRLRLIFTCCHPALAPATQVALTLRLLGGLETPEIARAFLVAGGHHGPAPRAGQAEDPRCAHPLPGAGRRRAARPPASRPRRPLPDLHRRARGSAGDDLVRPDLCAEAIRLARVLAGLMPDEPEVFGLLALLLLTDARRSARTSPDGAVVLLADQDRTTWDRAAIAEGHAIVRACLRRSHPGPYQLQAAINAVHTDAATADATDWEQILALYDQLLAVQPTPVVALNRAVAVAEVHGPARVWAAARSRARGVPPVPRRAGRPAAPAGPRGGGGPGVRAGGRAPHEPRGARLPPSAVGRALPGRGSRASIASAAAGAPGEGGGG